MKVGGFDTHSSLKDAVATKFRSINSALQAFETEMKAQGVWDQIVLLSSSDFGRTYHTNGAGTDHAWAGNYFLLGGAVNGSQLFGEFPSSFAEDSEVNIGRGGRILPTTPWESVWYGLSEWVGVHTSQMDEVLPNHKNFPNETMFPATSDGIRPGLTVNPMPASPLPPPSPPNAPSPPSLPPVDRCWDWCSNHVDAWSVKCRWAGYSCSDCTQCRALIPPPPTAPASPAPPPRPSLPPPPGFAHRGYSWFASADGGNCQETCDARNLTCVPLREVGYTESSCSTEQAICPNIFPQLASNCGSDGDGPKATPTRCVYRSHNYNGLTCNTRHGPYKMICACGYYALPPPSPPVSPPSPPPPPSPSQPESGWVHRGYSWFASADGGNCQETCDARNLTCVPLREVGYTESSCSTEQAICPNIFPQLASNCGSDGDGPKATPTRCVYRSHNYNGLTCNTRHGPYKMICACA